MKNLALICEAQIQLVAEAKENAAPSGKLEARVTTWGAREGADGRRFNYQPEGFAQWAAEFAEAGKPLPMFLNHNDNGMPMGEWNEFIFDDEGMSAKGRLFLNTVGGSDLHTVLKESPNMFGGVSVGAYAEEACMVDAEGNELSMDDNRDGSYFQITKGGLREVSVVMYPNNPHAEIQKLEAFDADGHLQLRVIEKALRESGLNRKDATTASLVFKKVVEAREALNVQLESLPIQGEPDAVVNEADELLKALELRELSKALQKRIK
jgi:HK97 family phage prohead protease